MMQKTHGQPAAEIAHLERDWAVILAGVDGTRLKSLTRRIAGDDRPKQFCSVLGGATLLEETQRRAALELPKERILFLVNQVHECFYAPLLANTGKRPGRQSSSNWKTWNVSRMSIARPRSHKTSRSF